MKETSILYSDIVSLSEHGLISDDSSRTITSKYDNDNEIVLYTNDKLMIIKRINSSISGHVIKVYNFTKIGKELSRIIDNFGNDVIWGIIKSYILQSINNSNIDVSLYNIISTNENNEINYSNEKIII